MICVTSWFGEADGWGVHSSEFTRALSRYEPVRRIDRGSARIGWMRNGLGRLRRRILPAAPDDVDLHLPFWVDDMVVLGSPLKIAWTVFEGTRIPEPHQRRLRRMDMIWAPSEWGCDTLAAAGFAPEMLRVVPEGVDAEVFRPAEPGSRDDAVFRFLCVGKWERRKGTAELVRAFCEEFDADEPVELVMHCGAAWERPLDYRLEIAQEIARAGGGSPRIVPSDRLDRDGLVRLMQRCHAFVLPTRAEGWGLPVLEAMACGLPAIVTDYSGLREFANERNAYLIPVERMVPLEDREFYDPLLDWGEWAQPDLAQLRRLMRFVYNNPDRAREKGRLSREDAAQLWTWDRAARIAKSHIEELRASIRNVRGRG